MKLINKEQVSHIILNREREGIEIWGTSFIKYLYVPEKRYKWWDSRENRKEGFYPNGEYSSFLPYYLTKEVDKIHSFYVKDITLWTKSYLQVFSCGKEIHRMYFNSYQELEQHVKENYDNCTIQYA